MPYSSTNLMLVYMAKIELPVTPIYYAEAGEFDYDGNRYKSASPNYGSIVDFDNFSSGIGDEAPSFELTFAPPDMAGALLLQNEQNRLAPSTFYKARADRDTGLIISAEKSFVGLLDYTHMDVSKGALAVKVGFATAIDLFFNTDKGNNLNSAFHRKNWPGEAGLDNTTGTAIPQPWGQKQ